MIDTMPRRGRRHVVLAVAVAVLLTLTGCGSSNDTNADETPAAATSGSLVPAAEGTTEYPLTLSTWAGESVLEERPERIAVIGFSTNLDALEILDVTPVYTQSEETAWPWRDEQWLSQIEYVDSATRRDPINFEGIASTNPDLIVAVNFVTDESEYEKLTDIAPVLEKAEQIDGDKIEWQQTQLLVGEALDLATAAEDAIDGAEQAITATAQDHPQFAGRTITVATDYIESGIDYYTVTGGTAEGILGQLGFEPNPLAQNFVDEPRVPDEQLAQLDADVLVMFYADDAAREAREQVPLFQSLPPVAEGRYIAVATDEPGSEATWVLRRGASVLSLPWAVEVLADWVSELDLP